MHDVAIPPELVQDPWEKNVPGFGLGRDPVRTPMQWNGTANGGFTTGRPWLPVSHDYRTLNVATERQDPTSMLALYRRLLELRRAEPALAVGTYQRVDVSGDAFSYLREQGNKRFLVVLNMTAEPQRIRIKSPRVHGRLVLSTCLDREGEPIGENITLRTGEGVVAALA